MPNNIQQPSNQEGKDNFELISDPDSDMHF